MDPSADTIDWFYGSVLVSGHDHYSRLCFDVRWEPEGDPEGCDVVDFLRLARQGKRKAREADTAEFIGTWTNTKPS
ncbi:hypothetical protein ACFXPV_32725 [Streptomyces sp. NPDC059118]|uniref:hypothetical protein n=1 Tax=unclassified Streptomyces TaxID=2593676 RepID=UPI0036CA25FF